MQRRSRYRGIAMVSAAAFVAIGLIGAASAEEPSTTTHTDNIALADHDSFPYGTDLAFNGDLVAAGAGAWDESARDESGVHILKRDNKATSRSSSARFACEV